MVTRAHIIFEPSGQRLLADVGSNCLEVIRGAGLFISTECGGKGRCGKCRVLMKPSPTPTEIDMKHLTDGELERGIRLSCEHVIEHDTRIMLVESDVEGRILTEGFSTELEQITDFDNEGELGIAIDLGTTTIVLYLMDLATGHQMAHATALNPQIVHGEDVISRLEFAGEDIANQRLLQRSTIECVEKLIDNLIKKESLSREQLSDIVVVGNTVMHHLILGFDTSELAVAPYSPTSVERQYVDASNLGFKDSRARMYFAPLIGGFVGSDIVALILSQSLHKEKDIVLAIDVGTNGEIVLSNKGDLYVCSTAAGSAFEGAMITHGMRAQAGAIEHLVIEDVDKKPDITVLENQPPRGLCGSGIVDVVAELLRTGLISPNGRLSKSGRSVFDPVGGHSYIIVEESEYGAAKGITFSQKDIRQVQTAKSAILTGAKILLDITCIKPDDIDRILLAGAFGNYINPKSALRIGLLPEIPVSRIHQVGNTAGLGAKMMLLSSDVRQIAESIAKMVTQVELASRTDFGEIFIESTIFPQ